MVDEQVLTPGDPSEPAHQRFGLVRLGVGQRLPRPVAKVRFLKEQRSRFPGII